MERARNPFQDGLIPSVLKEGQVNELANLVPVNTVHEKSVPLQKSPSYQDW